MGRNTDSFVGNPKPDDDNKISDDNKTSDTYEITGKDLGSLVEKDPPFDIINMSFVFTIKKNENTQDINAFGTFDKIEMMARYGNFAGLLAQPNTNKKDKILFTISAGNNGETSPDIPAGLPIFFPSLRNVMVAVVATDRSGQLPTWSNACGKAAKWCLAAPGKSINIAASEGSEQSREYKERSGTSFAAPMVAGGLAVVMQYFGDSMGHTEVLQRLYKTAYKTGRAAPDRIMTAAGCPNGSTRTTIVVAASCPPRMDRESWISAPPRGP